MSIKLDVCEFHTGRGKHTTEHSFAAVRTNMGQIVGDGFERCRCGFRNSKISRSTMLSMFRRCLFHLSTSSAIFFWNKSFDCLEVPEMR